MAKLSKQSVVFTLAFAFAVTGVFFFVRSIMPRGPAQPSPSAPAPIEPARPLPAFADPITKENVASRTREMAREAVAKASPELVAALTSEATESLEDQAANQLAIYLGLDFDRYIAFTSSHGADMPALAEGESAEQSLANLRAFWESIAGTIALRPVADDAVLARTRYVNGVETPQPDLGTVSKSESPNRYDIPRDPRLANLTIIEFVVPIVQIWQGNEAPVYWGIWLARPPGSDTWMPWRSVIYNPTGAAATVVPAI